MTATPNSRRTNTPFAGPRYQRNVRAIIGESDYACNRPTATIHTGGRGGYGGARSLAIFTARDTAR
jgi:hypothetical protein